MAEVADVTEKGDRREVADEGDSRTRGEKEVTKNGDKEERNEKEVTKNGDKEERNEKEVTKNGDKEERNEKEVTKNGDKEERNEKEVTKNGDKEERNEKEVTKNGDKEERNEKEVTKNGDKEERNEKEVTKNGDKEERNETEVTKNGDKEERNEKEVTKNGDKEERNETEVTKNGDKEERNETEVTKNGDKEERNETEVTKNGDKEERNEKEVTKNGDKEERNETEVTKNGDKEERNETEVTKNGDKEERNETEVTKNGDKEERNETEVTKNGDKEERNETEVTKNGDKEERNETEVTKNGDKEERNETETTTNGDREKERGEKETAEDEKCGIGTCHPQVMQRFSRVIFFTLSLSFAGFCSLLTGPMLVSQVTSIERQFGMNSTQVGALMSANDIGFALTVLVISHVAKDAHIPRILTVATFVFGIVSIFIAAMNFVQPHSLQNLDAAVNSSEARTKQLKYLCVPNLPNTTFDDGGCDDTEARRVDSSLPLVVAIGLLLSVQGITKATRAPLGVTYIDNNVPCRSKTGLHIGINLSLVLFGPPVGLAMGGFFSRLPVDLSDTTLKPTDPRWIGAWWMGFLLVGALSIVSSLPMLFFPRRLPFRAGGKNEAQETAKSRDEEADDMSTTKYGASSGRKQTGNDLEANGDSQDRTMEVEKAAQVEDLKWSPGSGVPRGTILQVLKGLPRSLLRLVQNPMYVILVMAFNFQIFALVGFASFLIKFVQRQFHIPPWLSSYVFGLSNLVFSGLGTFIGGVLVSRWNLTRRNCLRWAIVAHSIAVLLGAATLGLGCDPTPMVGLQNHDFVLDDVLSPCECDVSQYLPVCDGNRTFLSPCHAGCTSAANSTHFLDCGLAARPEATVGVCSPGCYLLIPFVVVQVLSSFFSSTAVTPSYVTILRSVSLADKTLGLGVVSFVMSLLAFIPAPIVFGAVVDRTCLIWSSTCGKSGACALYDVTKLRYSYIGVEIGFKVASLGLYALALFVLLWQVRTGRTKDEKPTLDLGNEPVCEEDGGRWSRLSSGPRALEMTHF